MSTSRLRRTLLRSLASLVPLATVAVALPGTASAAPATTTLFGQASASGFPAGVSVFDTVTLGQGLNPTGTLTFKLWAPGNTTCGGPPVFTSTKPVSGNGFYQSDSHATNQAGTYTWVASYSGDANNAATATACNEPNQAVTMGKRSPTLNTVASDPSPSGAITDTATLGNGAGPAGLTGTVTFSLWGPDNMICSGPPIFTSAKPVAGNGVYTSDPFTPTRAGSYRWTSKYSGDANNFPASTICTDPVQEVVVTAPAPSQTVRFVNRAYQDILGRAPNLLEMTLAVPLLEAGQPRPSFALSLATSPEFRQRAIENDHSRYLGRSVDALALTNLVAVLVDGWPMEVVTALIVGSDEFYVRQGGTPAAYVDALYRLVLGTTPDPATRARQIDELSRGVHPFQVAYSVLVSRAAHAKFVDAAYPRYLHRPADAHGRDYWTTHLDNGLRQESLIAFFVGSPEYWLGV